MMKKCKILGTAAAMMLVLALAGCENNTDDVDALKKRVDQMEQELADMEINNNLAESSQDKAAMKSPRPMTLSHLLPRLWMIWCQRPMKPSRTVLKRKKWNSSSPSKKK